MCESAAPLPDHLALCHEIIRQQADTIRESQRRIEQLDHQVEQLLRRQYGPPAGERRSRPTEPVH
jgi:transposase